MPDLKEPAADRILDAELKVRRVFGVHDEWKSLWRSIRMAVDPDVPVALEPALALEFRTQTAAAAFLNTYPEYSDRVAEQAGQFRDVVKAAARGRGVAVVEAFQKLTHNLGMKPPAPSTLRSELYRRSSRH